MNNFRINRVPPIPSKEGNTIKKVIFILLPFLLIAQEFLKDETYLIPYRMGEKYGYCNFKKVLKIPCSYDIAFPFSEEELARVGIKEKFGLIDREGKIVLPAIYDDIGNFECGHCLVVKDNKFGFANRKGKIVIDLKYDDALFFSEGLAVVGIQGRYGYIDTLGNTIIDFKFEAAAPFLNGYALVKYNGKFGFIDKKGNFVVEPIYDAGGLFMNGIAPVGKNGKYGYIDTLGKVYIDLIYDGVSEVGDNIMKLKTPEEVIFLRRDKSKINTAHYDDAMQFSEGLAVVIKNNKFGYIDTSGKEVIPLKFDEAHSFYKGYAVVRLGDDWGVIDRNGNYVVNPSYQLIIPPEIAKFPKGLFFVAKKGHMVGYVDVYGNKYWEE